MARTKSVWDALEDIHHDYSTPRRTTPMPSSHSRPEDDPKWRRLLIAECIESEEVTLLEYEELTPLVLLETKNTVRLGTLADATDEELNSMLVVETGPFTPEELPRYAAMLSEQLERQWPFEDDRSDEVNVDINGDEYPVHPWSTL